MESFNEIIIGRAITVDENEEVIRQKKLDEEKRQRNEIHKMVSDAKKWDSDLVYMLAWKCPIANRDFRAKRNPVDSLLWLESCERWGVAEVLPI